LKSYYYHPISARLVFSLRLDVGLKVKECVVDFLLVRAVRLAVTRGFDESVSALPVLVASA